jgi:NAD+ synthase (glutamine-hydrolysing)
VRLALCQINPTVGDIAGNAALIRAGIASAREGGADLVLFGELAVTGYPPEDLLLREHFLTDAQSALSELAANTHGVVAIVGFPERAEHVYNAAAVLADGAVQAIYRKVHLPNYGVFDERRYFQPGVSGATIQIGEQLLGLTVCEDIWLPGPPASQEAADGARLILNISASPYHAGKGAERERMFAERAREDGAPIAFCGLVGGQDELLFDGHSFVVDQYGKTIARAAQFAEDLLFCDLELDGPERTTDGDVTERPLADDVSHLTRDPLPPLAVLPGRSPTPRTPADATRLTEPLAPEEAEIYAALMLGLHDYVEKNGFSHVVLGLSGGIDSALVACLAADALGAQRVSAAIMPSPYSSSATQNDARALAGALGVRTHELEIEPVMDAYTGALQAELAGQQPDLTEENLQARIRGNLLMALSNKFGWLVLTTGNKSEMSVGYTTLYGDLAGGFAVIKDVPKTLVYRLCEWRNSPAGASVPGATASRTKTLVPASAPTPASEPDAAASRANAPIPPSILTRAPSAELRHDQRDEDSLPPYELLDRILYGYIELNHGREQLIAEGLPAAEVDRMIRLVDLAEYKRRQAPPGIKVTTRAFGRDRRMPITNRYRG